MIPYDEHSARSMDKWNLCERPTAGFVQQCYLATPLVDSNGSATVLLCNPQGDFAVQLSFGAAQLPCLTFWKYFAGVRDGYVLGIEPGTSFPNTKSVERKYGRVPVLGPGESIKTSFQMTFLDDSELIKAVTAQIAERQLASNV